MGIQYQTGYEREESGNATVCNAELQRSNYRHDGNLCEEMNTAFQDDAFQSDPLAFQIGEGVDNRFTQGMTLGSTLDADEIGSGRYATT